MTEFAHRTVEANGIPIHLAEAEAGLVLLCHGFPESWYSWRHQLKALAEAGYRAVAPDMRGYGQSDQPHEIDQYTLFHLVGDMVGVLDALSAPEAVVVGHDWGAPVAWHCALLRPDRFRAVAGFSVPSPGRWFDQQARCRRPKRRSSMKSIPGAGRRGGGAWTRSARHDPAAPLFRVGRYSAQVRQYLGNQSPFMVPRTGGSLTGMIDPPTLPAWLTEADIDFYAREFARAGFRGGLNWYRNIDRNWEFRALRRGEGVGPGVLHSRGPRPRR